MRGREMDGRLLVDAERVAGDGELASWVGRGVAAALGRLASQPDG